MKPELDRVDALGDAVDSRRHHRRLSPRDGRQQPVRRGHARGLRRRARVIRDLSVLDTTDETHDHRRRRPARPRAHALPRREQERRHGRARVDGAALLGAHVRARSAPRPAGTSSPSPIPGTELEQLRGRTRLPRSLPQSRRTSAGASRRCRCSASSRRAHRRRRCGKCSPAAATWRKAAGRRTTRTPGSSSAPSSAPRPRRDATS